VATERTIGIARRRDKSGRGERGHVCKVQRITQAHRIADLSRAGDERQVRGERVVTPPAHVCATSGPPGPVDARSLTGTTGTPACTAASKNGDLKGSTCAPSLVVPSANSATDCPRDSRAVTSAIARTRPRVRRARHQHGVRGADNATDQRPAPTSCLAISAQSGSATSSTSTSSQLEMIAGVQHRLGRARARDQHAHLQHPQQVGRERAQRSHVARIARGRAPNGRDTHARRATPMIATGSERQQPTYGARARPRVW
jgi:hypothetical protein